MVDCATFALFNPIDFCWMKGSHCYNTGVDTQLDLYIMISNHPCNFMIVTLRNPERVISYFLIYGLSFFLLSMNELYSK